MKRIRDIVQNSLSLKVLLSYIIIIILGVLVFVTAAEAVIPSAFERHVEAMAATMPETEALVDDLYSNFWQALVESGSVALSISLLIAMAVSIYTSRRIVEPIRNLAAATQSIANGHYEERIPISVEDSREPAMDEIDQLAVSFNRMALALETMERRRLTLVGNVAHELGTPLTSIKGYTEGLMDGIVPGGIETYERIYREAERMESLITGLQQLSRLEEEAFPLILEPIRVRALVEATSLRLVPQYEAKDVKLTVSVAKELIVLGDEAKLGQILLNLMGNALQYTPSGGQVQVIAEKDSGMARISIQDTGIGIAPEHLAHIFERFYRVDRTQSRAVGGLGLGLTICRHLVEAHGGSIKAQSPGLGQGSTFTFTIPLA